MTKATTIALAIALACFSIGCGVEEEPQRPRVTKQAPALAPMSMEERMAATASQDVEAKDYFLRSEGKTGGDVSADSHACRETLLADRGYVTSNGLVQFIAMVKCMKQKGWDLNEEKVPNASELATD